MSVDETIDRNRRNRGVVRAAVTNVIKSVEAELAKEVPDIEVLQDKLNILVKRQTDLQTLDETINGQIKLVELEKEVEHELEYSDSIIRCKDKIVGVDLIRIPSKGIASVLRQKGFDLSDQGSEDTEIGLLIGNDLMNKILTGKTYRLPENLMLYETIFGWVINGSSRGESASNCTLSMCTRVECYEEERLSDLLYNWFQLESLGINDSLSGRSETDEKIIQKFEENLRFENGRYATGLLWKREPVDLRDNFHLAKRQFDRFQGELKTNSFVRNQCDEIIKFQKANNIVEECNENETGYFMPYRSVVRKDKSTTQVR
ncbi:hypothetical protein AVEN_141731-1 [Araneus ventricosus]|uniref:Peptidase aspartic putative domain-containing protein n=1 Tax=Araneus ventricosus TaxID=182803 RepID=A0A4Y2IBL0_ARAVE|nr:hypothetical protein AVEN_141731-1 [Araneus ventricosus]